MKVIILTPKDLIPHKIGTSAYDFKISVEEINHADCIYYVNGDRTFALKERYKEHFNIQEA